MKTATAKGASGANGSPNGSPTEKVADVLKLDPHRVMPDPNNPRKVFRRIPQLAASIKSEGQEKPGLVTKLDGNPDFDYMLADGERRWRACKLAETHFEAILRKQPLSPAERLRKALGMNFNAEQHDHLEIAYGLRDLQILSEQEGKKITQLEISQIYGKSDFWVSVHLSLLRLSEKVQAMMKLPEKKQRGGYLTFSTALLLVNLKHPMQEKLATYIVEKKLSQSAARRYILKRTGAEGVGSVLRVASPGEASTSFGNKIQTAQDYLGVYCDKQFADLEKVFSTSSVDELRGYEEILSDIRDNSEGLIESLQQIIRHKSETGMHQIKSNRKN